MNQVVAINQSWTLTRKHTLHHFPYEGNRAFLFQGDSAVPGVELGVIIEGIDAVVLVPALQWDSKVFTYGSATDDFDRVCSVPGALEIVCARAWQRSFADAVHYNDGAKLWTAVPEGVRAAAKVYQEQLLHITDRLTLLLFRDLGYQNPHYLYERNTFLIRGKGPARSLREEPAVDLLVKPYIHDQEGGVAYQRMRQFYHHQASELAFWLRWTDLAPHPFEGGATLSVRKGKKAEATKQLAFCV